MTEHSSERSRFYLLPYMRKRFGAVGRKLAFTAENLDLWRRRLRRKLKELSGYSTMQRAPLRPRVTERVQVGEFVRERVEIQIEPGIVMPLYAVRLKELKGPLPAVVVVCPHGHESGGKVSTAGVGRIPRIARAIKH